MSEVLDDVQDQVSENFALEALTRAPFSMVLTNPNLDDNPIVYVNRAFEAMTGYAGDAAVGRNCRFLQGDDTDQPEVQALRDAIAKGEEITVVLRNHRADGEAFRNRLYVAPLTGHDGKIRYFLGVQTPVDKAADGEIDTALAEIQHRVKNHLAMIVGMIRLQAGKSDATEDFSTLARRVETLQLLYEELSDKTGSGSTNDETIALGAYITRVANAIAHLDGRSGIRVNIDADAIAVPFEPATRIGLIVSEIMTNSLQHAFEGRDAGVLEVRVKELSSGVIRVHVADDGIGMPDDIDWPNNGNLGSRIVKQLVSGLEAELSVETMLSGTVITFDIPNSVASTEGA